LCAAIFVAGVITIVALIVKPCEKETFMDIKNVKCNDLCAFSIPQNMTQKVNEVDSALLGNGTLFEEAGCSTIDCARRFCKHVEGVKADTNTATGRRLLAAVFGERRQGNALSEFIQRTSMASDARSAAAVPESTAAPPIELVEMSEQETLSEDYTWYKARYGEDYGPDIKDQCVKLAAACCLQVVTVKAFNVTKVVKTATDVSLLLDGSGSMLCRTPACTSTPAFRATDVNQIVVINNGAITVEGGKFTSIDWKDGKVHADGTATVATVEEKVDGQVTLSDGSGFKNPHDFYYNWNLEKLAASKLVDALAENLTVMTAGMAQFSIDAKIEAPQSAKKDLADVKKLIESATLRTGGTDFGSPLAICYDELLKEPAFDRSRVTEFQTSAKFCVLVTDGVPDETVKTQTMQDFCTKREIPLPECTMENLMYSIKQDGFIIFGVYVNAGANAAKVLEGQQAVRRYASCEARPVCPRTCRDMGKDRPDSLMGKNPGGCSTGDAQCVDDKAELKVRSGGKIATCAAALEEGLCATAGTSTNYTGGGQETIDIGRWSYGHNSAKGLYKPAAQFPKDENFVSGKCLYYADATDLNAFVNDVQNIANSLIKTVSGVEDRQVAETSSETVPVDYVNAKTEFREECLGSPLNSLLIFVFGAPLAILLIGKWLNDRRIKKWQANTSENEEGEEESEEEEFEADKAEKDELVVKEKEVGDWI